MISLILVVHHPRHIFVQYTFKYNFDFNQNQMRSGPSLSLCRVSGAHACCAHDSFILHITTLETNGTKITNRHRSSKTWGNANVSDGRIVIVKDDDDDDDEEDDD